MNMLPVFHDLRKVGTLSAAPDDSFPGGKHLSFVYDVAWTEFPISPHMPISTEEYTGFVVYHFFSNLLPEGRVLENISDRYGCSRKDVFQLLSYIGGDCSGALSLAKPDSAQSFTLIAAEELENRKGPVHALRGKAHMSLAGAQDKLGVVYLDGHLFLPGGSTPSTHILKPECTEEFPFCVANEFFIMSLAKKIGMDVPRVRLLRLPSVYYLVERYDRVFRGGRIVRRHQLDMCQMCNVSSLKKYEESLYEYDTPGVTLKDCMAVLPHRKDRERLLDWTIFNWLVGNTDAHAKNLSVFSDGRLAPFYDLLCVSVYGDEYVAMSFAIGGETNIHWVDALSWRTLARDSGFSEDYVLERVGRMARTLPGLAAELGNRLKVFTDDEQRFLLKVGGVIVDQCAAAVDCIQS